MSHLPLSKVDLNLLVVLDVLLRERSVARTANSLNVTPSAVSHALRRLRDLFGNELLIRDGRRMVPTSRGLQLQESLPAALKQIGSLLAVPVPFDPSTSDRSFLLAAPDFIQILMPCLIKQVRQLAPKVRIELIPNASSSVQSTLKGEVDVLLAPSAAGQEGLKGLKLGSWPWAVFGRRGHPAFSDWSIDSWAAYPHLQVRASTLARQGPIDEETFRRGIKREIGAVVPHFLIAAPVLAQTDFLLSVPTIAMLRSAQEHQLEYHPLPLELQPLELSLFTSATSGDEPAIRWFLQRVEAACQTLRTFNQTTRSSKHRGYQP